MEGFKFITQVKRPERVNVEMSRAVNSKVEKQGYITLKKQIESLMEAGKNLQERRFANYDYLDDVDIDKVVLPVSRSPNFDLVDAQHEYDSALERLKAQAKEKSSQNNNEASSTNSGASAGQKDVQMEPGKEKSIPVNDEPK